MRPPPLRIDTVNGTETTSQPVTTQLPSHLSLTGMTKRYPSVVVNGGMSLTVAPGEIHAMLGENGVGKSTLTKVVLGAVQPDAGEILLGGQRVEIANPHQTYTPGIAMMFQHFSLFGTLTVTRNVPLGLPSGTDLCNVADQVRGMDEKYGLSLEPYRHVHTFSVSERQYVKIMRALLTKPRLPILNKPISVLTPRAIEKLSVTPRQLVVEGTSTPYISHKLDEAQTSCHAATVMRMGKVTGVCDPRQETTASLLRMMIDDEPPRELRLQTMPGDVRMGVAGLSLPKAHAFATELRDIMLQLHSGEIIGIASVSGDGQQELLAALSGEDTRASAQTINIGNKPVAELDPRARRKRGLSPVPKEHLRHGAMPLLSLVANTLLTHQRVPQAHEGLIDKKATTKLTIGITRRFGVKATGPEVSAKSLSDGNLQKFVVGRGIGCAPRMLIAVQPTWGVDVGATVQIHNEILVFRAGGCAILIVLEKLDGLFALYDRPHMIADRRLSPSTPTHAANREQTGLWMNGMWNRAPASAAATLEVAHD